ncbi:MAG TPA: methyl-accepting chemotaxis protein [Steroidobacteraceae bacterium]|nr:methyl-accepting chemotaxis protein [Steroidobacteraceae bacterium]
MNARRLADLPLVFKMAFAPVVALVTLALLATGMMVSQRHQTAALERVVNQDMASSLALERIARRISTAHGELFTLMTHEAAKIDVAAGAARLKALLAELDQVRKDLAELAAAAPEAGRAAYGPLQKDLKDYRDGVEVVGSMLGVDFATAASFVQPFEANFQRMTATLDQLVDGVRQATVQSAAASHASAQRATLAALLATLVTLLVVAAIAVVGVQTVRGGVAAIAGATETLARGDHSIDLRQLARKDELGAIVRSLEIFRDAALEKERLQAESEQARRTAREERERNETAQRELSRQQAAVVESLAAGLGALAQGDLTVRLDQPFAAEYEALRRDFNHALEPLQQAIAAVVASAGSIQLGTGELRTASSDLSARTEQQAATIEETTASVEQVTTRVGKAADSAAHARSAVLGARSDAERSGALMQDAVRAMGDIQKSAQQIAQIVGVIDEIAFQTNLLALNAAVEAARSGDAGRGFAVVASEVRALAGRSAEAAKQIKALIAASSGQVEKGVALVGNTGTALEGICGRVAEIAELVGGIAQSANDQAATLLEINTAVGELDKVTQQNAAMVEQSTAAIHALAEDAESLAQLVARFRTATARPARIGSGARVA